MQITTNEQNELQSDKKEEEIQKEKNVRLQQIIRQTVKEGAK